MSARKRASAQGALPHCDGCQFVIADVACGEGAQRTNAAAAQSGARPPVLQEHVEEPVSKILLPSWGGEGVGGGEKSRQFIQERLS